MWGHSRVPARLGCSRSSFRSNFRSSLSGGFGSSSRNSCSCYYGFTLGHAALPVAAGDSVSRGGARCPGEGPGSSALPLGGVWDGPKDRIPAPAWAGSCCPSPRAEDSSPEPHLSMTGPAPLQSEPFQEEEKRDLGPSREQRVQEERQVPGTNPCPLRCHLVPVLPRTPGHTWRGWGGSAGARGCSGTLISLPEPLLPSPPPSRQRCLARER